MSFSLSTMFLGQPKVVTQTFLFILLEIFEKGSTLFEIQFRLQ
jgi:hypothetical protein